MQDVIVIGGGPAGIMASLSALKQNKSVLLIEKNNELGVKLRLTGGGRCNVTNNKPNDQLIKQVHNGRFLFSSLMQFNADDIIKFFKEYGLQLKEEDHNRMFPVSNKSIDVINTLKKSLFDFKNFKVNFNEQVERKKILG